MLSSAAPKADEISRKITGTDGHSLAGRQWEKMGNNRY
jgi:hypothetical protein